MDDGLVHIVGFHSRFPSFCLEQGVFLVASADDVVGQQDQDKSDQGLVQTGGGRHSDIAERHQAAVNVSVDNVRYRLKRTGVERHLVEQAEIGVENAADRQQRHDCDGRRDERYCNGADLLPFGRAVDRGRFVILVVDADDRGQEDDAQVTGILPDLNDGQDVRPVFRLEVPGDRLQSEHRKQIQVQEAALCAKHRENQITDDNHGNQERKKNDALIETGSELVSHFIKQNRDRNCHDRIENNKRSVIKDGVPGNDVGIRRLEQILEVFKADPIAAEYTLGIVDVLEGDDHTEHRQVIVDNEVDDPWNHHQKQCPVTLELLEKRSPSCLCHLLSPSF